MALLMYSKRCEIKSVLQTGLGKDFTASLVRPFGVALWQPACSMPDYPGIYSSWYGAQFLPYPIACGGTSDEPAAS